MNVSDPEKDPIGHIIKDVIFESRGAPIQQYWTKRRRNVKGQYITVIVRKRKRREQIRIID